jgi:hypothetical protein
MLGVNTRTRTSSSHIEEGMTTVAHPPHKGYRTIRLPLAESAYDRFLTDRSSAEDRLEELSEECAALLPDALPWGDTFFGFTEPSINQQLLCRRMRLDQGRTVFTIAPAFVLPSMTGRTHDVDHALFLRRLPVPWWAIAHVFGRDAMSWERLAPGLGRFRLGGTPVTHPQRCPQDLVADEKPSALSRLRIGVADFGTYWEAPDHKEVSHEQEVRCASVG